MLSLCLIWARSVLAGVRLRSDTVHSEFSTEQAGFSLAWAEQLFVSNLWKLPVMSSPWVHSAFLLTPFLSCSHSLPPPFSGRFFPLGLCLPNWRYNPTKEPPQSSKPESQSHRKHKLVSYLLLSHPFLCLTSHPISI